MFTMAPPSDFVVAEAFRWQGILYKEGSSLPAGMPAAAMTRFLHRTPPLIKKVKVEAVSSNGTRKKTSKKKTTKKTKKTAKR